jgi:hypothetical protein
MTRPSGLSGQPVIGSDVCGIFPQEFDLVTGKMPDYKKCEMKVKTFEVVLHMLPSGKSPETALEEQINQFLAQHPRT